MNIIIRNEIETDIQAISEITRAAFENLQISPSTSEDAVMKPWVPNNWSPTSFTLAAERTGL